MSKPSVKQAGFTIVELLIVIVVIAILAAITIVAYNGIQQRARVATVSSDLEGAAKQLAMDQVTTSTYPATVALANNGAGLKASPGTTYQYAVNNSSSPQTFCITATNSTTSYFVSSTNNVPTTGACAGQGAGGVAAVTNLATDPEAKTAAWLSGRWFGPPSGGGTWSFITGASDGPAGLTSYHRKTWTTAGNAGDTGMDAYASTAGGNAGKFACTPGQSLTASGYMRHSSVTSKIFYLRFVFLDAAGATIGQSLNSANRTTTAAEGWQRMSASVVAPAGAVVFIVILDVNSNATQHEAGSTVDGTGLMLTQGSTVYNYADGNSPNWLWNGTLNASTSTGPPL